MAEDPPCHSILLQDKPYLAPVILWPCGKVQPIDGATPFKEEFVESHLLLIGNIQQDGHVTDGLLLARTVYIYRTILILGPCN